MSLVERAAGRLRPQLLEGKPASRLTRVIEPVHQPAPVVDRLATIARVAEHLQVGGRPPAARGAQVAAPRAKPSIAFDREQLKHAAIVDWSMARSRMTEEVRIIKRQLLSSAFPKAHEAGARADVIMVTSAHPGEGKTFTALNLAFGIAKEPNHHVLLVDVDGSRQGLRRFLSAGDLPGLLDLVADPAVDVAETILRTDNPHLSVVLAGTAQEHGPELLASQRMRSLINEMAVRYDDQVILLDAPPCLFSSDPAALAAIVGQVVFVIEADRTQRGDVEASLELLRACPRISLVLNKTKVATSHSFGSYPYS